MVSRGMAISRFECYLGRNSYNGIIKNIYKINLMDADQLKNRAREARKIVIEILTEAGSGHLAGSLGMADVFTAFYFHILKHDPKNPEWAERDRLFLSNGHICPIQYVIMAMVGYFSVEELRTLRKLDSRLQGHPEKGRLSGIESTSGPLGLGLGQASGYALAAKRDNRDFKIYCILSDGEHDEGNTWESIMFAAKYKLDNLIAVVDRNKIQSGGNTENIMPLEPLVAKYQSFGWQVLECDGNNAEEFINTIEKAKNTKGKPTAVIANTIPGKGVLEIENDYHWHAKVPTKEEADRFMKQLI